MGHYFLDIYLFYSTILRLFQDFPKRVKIFYAGHLFSGHATTLEEDQSERCTHVIGDQSENYPSDLWANGIRVFEFKILIEQISSERR